MTTLIFTGLLLTLPLSAAPAGKCSDGRVISVDSAGHCCWPGQAWSSSRNTCVGVPTACPTGTKLEGESCVTLCEPGKSVGPDTAGRCCWPAQVWSTARKTCIGIPECPAGMQASGEQCVPVCPAGQLVTADTGGRCCWPSQVWSTSRSTCIGIPSCPAGFTVSGESCVAPMVRDAFSMPLPPPPPLQAAAPAPAPRPAPAPAAPAPAPAAPAPAPVAPAPPPAAAVQPPTAAPEEPPSDPLAVLPLPPPPPLPEATEEVDAETKRVFLPLSPENDSAWQLHADVLFDATQQRIGVRARFDHPFSQGKSSFALGGGLGVLSPKFTSPSDSLVVFPLEAFASYRIGFADGRFQLIPRVGPVVAVLLERGNFSAVLKGSVGTAFRFSLGQPGNRRGLIAGADFLFPIAGAGWVFLFSFGTTI